jgi:hypothetical protein
MTLVRIFLGTVFLLLITTQDSLASAATIGRNVPEQGSRTNLLHRGTERGTCLTFRFV